MGRSVNEVDLLRPSRVDEVAFNRPNRLGVADEGSIFDSFVPFFGGSNE